MKLRRDILAIAIPAIISNITTPLLGLADVTITGHIGSPVYIGAIAVGGTMFNILYWLFNFLRMGTSGPTAQAYGAEDGKECRVILWRGLTVAVIIAALLLCLSSVLADSILAFMDADDATQALARKYFNICIAGCPAVLIVYALSGWFLGMQNSRVPMWMSIITNLVNIPISIYLVFYKGMKIEGVAMGTLSAQWVGAIIGLITVFVRYHVAPPPIKEILSPRDLLTFFRINSDIFLRTACIVAVTLWFTHAGAIQSVEILAANAVLLQLFMLFSFFMDGFAYAAEALAGKHFGSGNSNALSSLIHTLKRIGLVCAIIFSAVYFAGGEFIISIITKEKEVVNTAIAFLPWAVAVPLCGFLAFIWDGILIGLVRPRGMLVAMLISVIIFFIIYFSLTGKIGNNALWLSFCAYLLSRGLIEDHIYEFHIKKEIDK